MPKVYTFARLKKDHPIETITNDDEICAFVVDVHDDFDLCVYFFEIYNLIVLFFVVHFLLPVCSNFMFL